MCKSLDSNSPGKVAQIFVFSKEGLHFSIKSFDSLRLRRIGTTITKMSIIVAKIVHIIPMAFSVFLERFIFNENVNYLNKLFDFFVDDIRQ